jgi:ATP-binding cassette, sub-family E, member 1
LSGKLKPNLGRYDNPPDWEDILKYFRGSELQSKILVHKYAIYKADRVLDYFTKLLEDDLKAVVKPQYVDQIPKAIRQADKSVKTLMESRASLGNLDHVVDTLGAKTQAPRKEIFRY